MSGLYLVADDLTGALDSAVSFCGSLGPIPVFLGAPHDPSTGHAAVDLATRDANAEFASLATLRVARRLAAADIAYKKIDSRLRGHWAIELAALMGTGAFNTCVCAPAFPSQGRTTLNGRQLVRAADGSSSAIAVDLVGALRSLGLHVVCASAPDQAELNASVSSGPCVVVFDAATDEDLRAVVRWGSQRNKPVLWCGSAGLARALAQLEPPRMTTILRPVLAVIGTDDAVSRAQIEHVVSQGSAPQVVVAQDVAQAATETRHAFEQKGRCLMTFELPRHMAAADAATSIGQTLRDLLPLIPRPSALVVAGGETLLSVCRAVGATYLEVGAEFSPGIPCSRLRAGIWDGLPVVSKSGAFGSPQLLAELFSVAL